MEKEKKQRSNARERFRFPLFCACNVLVNKKFEIDFYTKLKLLKKWSIDYKQVIFSGKSTLVPFQS